jgi:energy-coupling factor transport system ATP-binding protein
MPIIELQEISFKYRGSKHQALDQVTLSVEAGEFVGILGPTGAGKSTLCWVITGVAPQIIMGKLKGTAMVMGKPTRKTPVSEITQMIGLVQQDAEAQLLMTDIEKEIVFPLENLCLEREEISRRLEYVLDLVNLQENRQRHPFYLSGGQKQRVAVAAALAMQPEVLILDEATSELDPLGAEEIHNLAGDLKKQGKTIIMIEHNIDELTCHADRLVVMDEGKIVKDGPTREVLEDIDLLTGLGLYPPQVTQVGFHLRRMGFEINPLPITPEEAVETFSKLRARSS